MAVAALGADADPLSTSGRNGSTFIQTSLFGNSADHSRSMRPAQQK
ncbi:hypothetical protein [Bradyrhizobium sp.]